MDMWEANNAATALTPHPCNIASPYKCPGHSATVDPRITIVFATETAVTTTPTAWEATHTTDPT